LKLGINGRRHALARGRERLTKAAVTVLESIGEATALRVAMCRDIVIFVLLGTSGVVDE
jgi:hypothetical protein